MYGLYDINFQSKGEFYKIRIRYNVIHNWSTMNHLKKWSKFATKAKNMLRFFQNYTKFYKIILGESKTNSTPFRCRSCTQLIVCNNPKPSYINFTYRWGPHRFSEYKSTIIILYGHANTNTISLLREGIINIAFISFGFRLFPPNFTTHLVVSLLFYTFSRLLYCPQQPMVILTELAILQSSIVCFSRSKVCSVDSITLFHNL
jgi:hypothetical protein